MIINLAWPRAEFFGPAWYQQYVAVIVIPALALLGAAFYWFIARGRERVLSEHSAQVVPMFPGGGGQADPG